MAELGIFNTTLKPDAGVYQSQVADQLTLSNQSGEELVWVLTEGASDAGWHMSFTVPSEYSSGASIVVTGILDGALSGVTLAMAAVGAEGGDNDAYDIADSSEDTGTVTAAHADMDRVKLAIAFSNITVTAGEKCKVHLYLDISANDYAGNFLVEEAEFVFTAA